MTSDDTAMTKQPKFPAAQKLPRELPEEVAAEQTEFRSLSLADRGRLLEAVCAATMDVLMARQQMGIPMPEPEPWPASTQEFMRKHAPNGRNRTAS